MPEELSREIRKLEVRLENFRKKEDAFVNELKRCIEKLWELNESLERLGKEVSPKEAEELLRLQLDLIKAFGETMKRGGEAEHERSHLL